MLENMKFISRVEQDISLVRFAHLWDILFNSWDIFHIFEVLQQLKYNPFNNVKDLGVC
jgi:hypothetical protein